MRTSLLLIIGMLFLCLGGCSSSNSDSTSGIHAQDWTKTHRVSALSLSPAFAQCQGCHGVDLKGGGTLPGCFSLSYENQVCHVGGPGTTPHPIDGTYLSGSNHGPVAKADLTVCQTCHASAGGPGSNPRFNRGISSAGGQGCEGCHGVNYAHPAAWAGPNATFHYSAGNIQNACTLCHGTALDGVAGVGVSCLNCHAETVNLTLNCNACHGTPPDGGADFDVLTPVPHGNVSNIVKHDECLFCHGVKPSVSGGSFAAVAGYKLFNKASETLGDHWNGKINMSSSVQYNQDNFGCDTAGCHGNNPAHRLSDSGLPVELGAYGDGPALLHPVDGSFLLPANHGPAAKGLTAAFPNGIVDCQPCHATEGANPRFNIGITSSGGRGCEGCHNDYTAHPSKGSRESVDWFDLDPTHSKVPNAKYAAMCTLCHGAALDGLGGVPGAGGCNNCHQADPITNLNCVSCHSFPPNGSTGVAGDVRPNRTGNHLLVGHSFDCKICHSGVGYRTDSHFDQTSPADVVIQANVGVPEGAGSYDAATGSCSNISCHGGAGTVKGPW